MPLRIMPLGDSITSGVGDPARDGYRRDLQQRFAAAGQPVDFVGSQTDGFAADRNHEGHGGWTIDQLAVQADTWLATYRPDVILLHMGTNDITRREAPGVAAAKLSALIDQIRWTAPAAHLYVGKIIATGVPAESPSNRRFNDLIPGIVAGKGPRVHVVDHSGVDGVSLYDRHHPNEYGYSRMSYRWYTAIRATLHPEWPVTANPFTVARAYLCHWVGVRDCRWWRRTTAAESRRTPGQRPRRVARWTPEQR
ncbi:SGNH/GDSL hydrolase family protein [Actinoplanes sp. NBRC 101535]|uniref:SGNH/GDSL hydrolase family protein n=1 Tax=Actinoplanes sp. NBRC 101535 TaxID=3032196 RepID=UPI0025534D90|nr:SGNH/GDSL hydrolase family protein [Actinoplanes sp. NBRC 101535]